MNADALQEENSRLMGQVHRLRAERSFAAAELASADAPLVLAATTRAAELSGTVATLHRENAALVAAVTEIVASNPRQLRLCRVTHPYDSE